MTSLQLSTGNIERGWNDPPVFLYDAAAPPVTQRDTPVKKHALNKRVAFPGMTGSPTTSSPGTASQNSAPTGAAAIADTKESTISGN